MPLAAATVVSASGETSLWRASALLSPARAGTTLTSGDRVVTRADGRIELRFSDGALVALQPNTEFRIDDYRFDVVEQRGFFSLVKGGLRTVSGAIGKRHRDDYRVNTPSATIGIRGTEYEASEPDCGPRTCEPGVRPGLTVRVIQGRVAVSNEGGSVEVPAGAAVHVADRRSPPPAPRPLSAFPPVPARAPEPVTAPAAAPVVPAAPVVAPAPAARPAPAPAPAPAPTPVPIRPPTPVLEAPAPRPAPLPAAPRQETPVIDVIEGASGTTPRLPPY